MRQSQKIIIVGCIGIIIVLIIMRRKSTDNNSVNNSVNNPVNNNEEPIRPPGYKPIDEEPVVPTPVIPPPPPPPPPRPNCSGGQVLNESSNTCICPDPLQSWNGQCNCPGRHPVSGVGMIVDNGTKKCICPNNAHYSGSFCYCPVGFKEIGGQCCSAGRPGMPASDGQILQNGQCVCAPGKNFSGGGLG